AQPLLEGVDVDLVGPYRTYPLQERQEAADRVGHIGEARPAGPSAGWDVAAQLGRWKARLQEGLEQLQPHLRIGSGATGRRRGPAHHLLVQRPGRIGPGWAAEVDLPEGGAPPRD